MQVFTGDSDTFEVEARDFLAENHEEPDRALYLFKALSFVRTVERHPLASFLVVVAFVALAVSWLILGEPWFA